MGSIFYYGIDPGVAGGVAAVNTEGRLLFAVKMPDTDRDVLDLFTLLREDHPGVALLEFVASSPQMGVRSAFTFGQGYGRLRMALVAAGVSFDTVVPRKWQQTMSCVSGGDKNVTKRRAQELFPGLKVTHAIADAMLLAECCRRRAIKGQW